MSPSIRRRRITVPVATRAPDGRVAAYLLGEDLLVDPGGHSDALDRAVAETDPDHVLCTHHHPDHTGAVARYADGRTVWARTGRTDAFATATGVAPDRTFRDGTDIPTGEGTVTVVDAPGHAPEHVAFQTPDGILCGDAAVAEGSVVVGAPEGDMRAYLTTLRRLYARDPDRLFPAHGPVVDAPRAVLARLLAHRLDRERRVLGAVEAGADTVDAVLDAAYEKDLTGVEDLARATVRAHLEKLAVEGRVHIDGDRVRP